MWVGFGLKMPPIGWKKTSTMTVVPETACTEVLHSPTSTKIIIKAETVRTHVKTIEIKWQKNQMSFPQFCWPFHCSLKYRAIKIPIEAVPIHAIIIKIPWTINKVLCPGSTFAGIVKFTAAFEYATISKWFPTEFGLSSCPLARSKKCFSFNKSNVLPCTIDVVSRSILQ